MVPTHWKLGIIVHSCNHNPMGERKENRGMRREWGGEVGIEDQFVGVGLWGEQCWCGMGSIILLNMLLKC